MKTAVAFGSEGHVLVCAVVENEGPFVVTRVVETKGHFVAKAMFGKIELNYWFFFCDIQSWGHNV